MNCDPVHGRRAQLGARARGAGGGLGGPRAGGGAPRRRVPGRDRAHARVQRARRRHRTENQGRQTLRLAVPRVSLVLNI